MRRVFVLNHDEAVLYAYADYLKANGYEVFATTNDYKFILYSREIDADIFVIDTKKPDDSVFFERLKTAQKNGYTPILVLTDYTKKFVPHETIAHILFKPFKIENFADIIESYGIGKRSHDLLLVEKFREEDTFSSNPEDFTVFKIYNMDAANSYLEKNSPANIVINLQEKSEKLPPENLFYVENRQKHQDTSAVLD